MGTNYYSLDGQHIGKKSAAGNYCWDCGITLCKDGESKVHYGAEWYDACPKCGKKPADESLDDSAAGRELGFNQKPYGRKKGVRSCSSFTWAVHPNTIMSLWYIRDEYKRTIGFQKFKKILRECPIQYYNMIGEEFS